MLWSKAMILSCFCLKLGIDFSRMPIFLKWECGYFTLVFNWVHFHRQLLYHCYIYDENFKPFSNYVYAICSYLYTCYNAPVTLCGGVRLARFTRENRAFWKRPKTPVLQSTSWLYHLFNEERDAFLFKIVWKRESVSKSWNSRRSLHLALCRVLPVPTGAASL